jgi:hypothetical protein
MPRRMRRSVMRAKKRPVQPGRSGQGEIHVPAWSLGKARHVNARSLAKASHYVFEPEFCNPAAGWEKG